jgi:hypothetical protein
MSIKAVCACCGRELERPGAILFGPPADGDPAVSTVAKYHVCRGCFEKLRGDYLESGRSPSGELR